MSRISTTHGLRHPWPYLHLSPHTDIHTWDQSLPSQQTGDENKPQLPFCTWPKVHIRSLRNAGNRVRRPRGLIRSNSLRLAIAHSLERTGAGHGASSPYYERYFIILGHQRCICLAPHPANLICRFIGNKHYLMNTNPVSQLFKTINAAGGKPAAGNKSRGVIFFFPR